MRPSTSSHARPRRSVPTTCAIAAAVALGVAVTGVSPAAAAATATATATAVEGKRTPTKTRLLDALLRGEAPASAGTAARLSAVNGTAAQDATSPLRSAPDSTSQATSSPTCLALSLDWTLGHDRVVLAWDDAVAGPYRVQRLRDGGSVQTLTTTSGTRFEDTGLDTHGIFSYRVIPANGTICLTPELSMGLGSPYPSVSGSLGLYPEPEAVSGRVASDGSAASALLQDTYSLGEGSHIEGVDPSFSSDGRRVATSVEMEVGARGIVVQQVDAARWIQNGPAPAGTVALDPEFSIDGRLVVYTRYSVDPDSGEVTGTRLRMLDVVTGADSEVEGSDGLIQPDWVTPTTLVAAGREADSGLSYLPAAGGTPTPIAGTEGGAQPEVGQQSQRIWFVTDDGTTSRVRAVVRPGSDSVGTARQSTTVVFDQLRHLERTGDASNDARYFHVEIDPGELADDPSDDTATVVEDDYMNRKRPTPVGVSRAGVYDPWGFDVRRPVSKGAPDLADDSNGDILARDPRGNLWVYPSTKDDPAASPRRVGTGWNVMTAFLSPGDLTGDSRADILAKDSAGTLWRYDGLGGAAVAPKVRIGTGWQSYLLIGAGDWDGDGTADLLARAANGDLRLYPGRLDGTLGTPTRIGTGWTSMNAVFGGGDVDLDGAPDLLAREARTGILWLYPGTGTGGFLPRRKVGTGWNAFTQLSSPEMYGTSPVVHAVTPEGELLLYRVLGDGRLSSAEAYRIGTGWRSFTVAP